MDTDAQIRHLGKFGVVALWSFLGIVTLLKSIYVYYQTGSTTVNPLHAALVALSIATIIGALSKLKLATAVLWYILGTLGLIGLIAGLVIEIETLTSISMGLFFLGMFTAWLLLVGENK